MPRALEAMRGLLSSCMSSWQLPGGRAAGVASPDVAFWAQTRWRVAMTRPGRVCEGFLWGAAQAGLKNTEHISFGVLVAVKALRHQVMLFTRPRGISQVA